MKLVKIAVILAVVGTAYLLPGGGPGGAAMDPAVVADPSPDWLRRVVDAGVVLLVAIPIANVIQIAVAESRRRAWLFAGAASVVLVMIGLNVATLLW